MFLFYLVGIFPFSPLINASIQCVRFPSSSQRHQSTHRQQFLVRQHRSLSSKTNAKRGHPWSFIAYVFLVQWSTCSWHLKLEAKKKSADGIWRSSKHSFKPALFCSLMQPQHKPLVVSYPVLFLLQVDHLVYQFMNGWVRAKIHLQRFS